MNASGTLSARLRDLPGAVRVGMLSLWAAVLFALFGAGAAMGYLVTTDSSHPAVAVADAMPAGPSVTSVATTPTAASGTVTLSFPRVSTDAGVAIPASDYTIRRYPAAGGSAVTVTAVCSGSATVTCTESAAPDGAWKYTVQATYGSAWTGTEGALSAQVRVDTTSPTAAISYPVSSTTYGATWAGAFSGTASDSGGGVAGVSLTIADTTSGTWWNGTSWQGTTTTVPTLWTTSWTYPFAALNLTSGDGYAVTATATDGVGNTYSTSASSFTYFVATKLVITTQPTPTVAGATMSPEVTVAIEDAAGHVSTTDSASTVSLALLGGSGTLTGGGSATVGAGVATYSGLSIDKSGNAYTLSATASGLTTATSNVFSVNAGAASSLGFTTQPSSSAVAGSPFATQPVVAVQDALGNTVTGSTASVTLSAFGGSGSVSCTADPVNAVSGVATFAGCRLDVVGSYTLTASATGLTGTTSQTITVAASTASKLVFTTQPSGSATAGAAFGAQPVVTVQDAFGNTVSGSVASILLTSSGGTFTCTGGQSKSATAGVATFAGCANTTAGTFTLSATSSGLTSATSTSTAVTAGTATKLAFTTQPSGATGGTDFTTQPVVSVQDTYGNTVTTSSASIALSAGGGFACTSSTIAATSGVATFAGCAIDTIGTYAVTATSTGLTTATSSNITVALGAAAKLGFTTQPSSTATSNVSLTTQPVVTVQDAGGNTVNHGTQSITLTASGSFSCTTNPVSANYTSGAATFAGCRFLTVGSYTITATSGALTGTSTSVTVSAGPANKLAFTTQPSTTATAGTAFAQQPVVTVQDASGNTITGSTASITLSSGGTLTCTTNPLTATAGIATFAGCANTAAGSRTLTAAATGLTSATSTSTTVSAAAAAQVGFTTQPSASTSAGSALAAQPVVAIQDTYGNTVTTSTATVTLAPSAQTLTCTGGLSKAAVAGVATFAGCSMTVAGSYTLTASSGALTSDVSSSYVITATTANKLAFSTQPSSTATGGTAFGTQPVVTVQDTYGNAVTSSSASVTLTANAGGGGSITCSSNPRTASSGVATFAGCSIATSSATAYAVTASSGALTTAVSTSITVSTGAATQVAFTTQPSASTAAGTAFATQPVVAVQDAGGNTVTSSTDTVTLAPSAQTLTCTGGLSKAAVAGVATFAGCSMTIAGSYTLTASSGALTSDVSSSYSITATNANKLAFTTQPSTTATGGTVFATQPVVTVQDTYGNAVTSSTASITLTANAGGGGAITCTSNPRSASSGVATFAGCSITTSSATAYTLTAAATGLTSATSNSITVSTGSAAQVTFTTQPSASTSAGTALAAQPVVAIQDAGGNAVTSSTATVTLAPSAQTLTCTGGQSKAAVAGVATFAGCSMTIAGSYTLTASGGALTTDVSSSYSITATTASKLAFTTQPSTTATGGTAFATQPVVTVQDTYGNTVTGSTASITLSPNGGGGGGALTCTTNPVTATSGVATFAGCSLDKNSGTAYTLTASTSGLTGATSGNITVSVGPGTKLSFSQQPSSSANGGTAFGTQPKVTVLDAGGNTVTSSSAAVTLTANAGGGGTISCTSNPVNASSGVATFAGCSISTSSGTAYTLTASSGSMTTATSTSITVSTGSAAKLAFTTQPSSSVNRFAALAQQPVVTVQDAGGNTVTGSTASIVLSAGGGFSCTATTKSAVAGVATFANCRFTATGSYTIGAASNPLTAATSTSITVN